MTSILEAGTYRDVDGVMITGEAHRLNLLNVTLLFANHLRPAVLAGFGLYDPGYITTLPGHRAAAFHDPGIYDPSVIAADEATKDVAATTSVPDGLITGTFSPLLASLIDAPVLVVEGAVDPLFCGPTATDCSSDASLRADEGPMYADAPCFEAFVSPNAGHDVNLALSAPAYQARALTWATSVISGGCPNG